jgi:hypothetical protein
VALISNSVKQAYLDFLNTPDGVALYQQFKRLLYTQDDSLIQWLNTSVLSALPPVREHNARVCDIGGGDGYRIRRILQFLHDNFRNRFRLDFIEQSPLHVAAFDPVLLGQFCRIKVHNRLFEHVTLPTQSYDLVFLIHSIFAFENGKSIDKVLSLRRHSGNIVIVSNSPDSFLGGLKRIVDGELSDKRFELDDVEVALHELGITYERNRTYTEWAIDKEDMETRYRRHYRE